MVIGHIRREVNGQPTFRFYQGTKRIEEPPVAVKLLLVLFFETKDDLDGAGVHGGLPSGGTENIGGKFKDVRSHGLAIHGVFSNTFLVTAHL
jgi:hypothetical protein